MGYLHLNISLWVSSQFFPKTFPKSKSFTGSVGKPYDGNFPQHYNFSVQVFFLVYRRSLIYDTKPGIMAELGLALIYIPFVKCKFQAVLLRHGALQRNYIYKYFLKRIHDTLRNGNNPEPQLFP